MSDDKHVAANKEEKDRGRDDGYCSSNESDFDLQANAFLQSCPHLDLFRESANICDPSLWHCRECSTTESVWVCLSCGYFGCGRYQNGHAKQHFQQTAHPLVLEINEKLCYCYPCKNYVTNDTPDGAIGKIRQKLEEEQTQRTHANKRKKLRNSAIFKKGPSSFEKQDKLTTVIQQWKMYHLYRAFNKWKHVWQANKNAAVQVVEGHGENTVAVAQVEQKASENGTSDGDVVMNDVQDNKSESAKGKTSKKRAREETEAEANAAESEGNKKTKRRKTEKEPSIVLRKIIKPGETGLRNLGNTCYMNSILQSLSNTTLFRDYLLWHVIPRDKPAVINKHVLHREPTVNIITSISKSPVKHGDEVLLTKEIHNLLRVMWSGKWAVVTPYSLLQGIWTCMSKFHSHQQQDVQEFLCYLLDRLNSELMGDKNTAATTPATSENRAKLRKSFSSLRMSLTGKPINSIINEIFEGQLLSEIRCMECGHRSSKRDPFLDLSLEIPEQFVQTSSRGSRNKKVNLSCDLSECIDGFMRAEELGADSYWCEQCKAKRNATKKFYIARPPKVLVLVIKRFCWTTSSRAKIDTRIQFPLKGLNVAPYMYDTPSENNNNNAGPATATAEYPVTYNLRSLIVHHGIRLLSGHYSCYCFNDEKGAWVHFNDAQVTVETPEEVESAQPYMLFYEREDTEPANRSQEPPSEEDLDARMLEDLSIEFAEEDASESKDEPKTKKRTKAEIGSAPTSKKGNVDEKRLAGKATNNNATTRAQAKTQDKGAQKQKNKNKKPDAEPSSESETQGRANQNSSNNNKNINNSDDEEESSSNEEEESTENSSDSESVETPQKSKSKPKVQPKKKPITTAKKSAPARKAPPKPAPKKSVSKKATVSTTKSTTTTKSSGTTSNIKTRSTKVVPETSKSITTRRSKKSTITSASSSTATSATKKTRRR